MPVDYLQIKNQLPAFCTGMKDQQIRIGSAVDSAQRVLRHESKDQQAAIDKIRYEISQNPFLRSALPTSERMDGSYPLPELAFTGVILAADGSQILPSRQRQVNFSVINVGLIVFASGSGEAPAILRFSELLNYDDDNNSDQLSEGYIALHRDLAERSRLLEVARKYPSHVVALTDGGIELYLEQRSTMDYEKALLEYRKNLDGLQEIQAITAGFVDKPGSSFVMQMLDILAGTKDPGKLPVGIDRMLFERILVQPGSRSAVYQIVSNQNRDTNADHAVHFFYLNTSQENHPKIARIEIPGWVAANKGMIDVLHRVLIDQCHSMRPPFPYILHRAHEEAVITLEESARLEDMIVQELYQQHGFVGEKSGKQTHKDAPGRTRY